MAGELQHGMQCAEFDALLTDALDGVLNGPKLVRFNTHKSTCTACSEMFTEAQAGMNWLKALPEVDPPAGFAERILLATSGVTAKAEAPRSWKERLRGLVPNLRPVWHTVMQPRFAMSFGMAFFSITLVLNVAGVKLSSLKASDLRPSTIAHNYYETRGRLVKYYENIRLVYELETFVRPLRKVAAPEEKRPDQNKDQKKSKQGNEPEQQQNYQNYSLDDSRNVLANCRECDLVDYWFVPQRSEI
jgi:hypothetical protein